MLKCFFSSLIITYSCKTLQDVQFRVPMESRRDVDKVKDALDVDGKILYTNIICF
jgi:hypothetical protein